MIDADGADLQWLDDFPFDETSDVLLTPPLAFADDLGHLDLLPGPASDIGTSSTRDESDHGSQPLAGAASEHVSRSPRQEKTDTAGKAAARLARKAEQNRPVFQAHPAAAP